MTKHTEGPWKWSPKLDTENRSLTGNEKEVGDRGEHIPIIYLHEGWCDEAIKQANMSLIAAAPDLLKACKEMVAIIQKWSDGDYTYGDLALDEAFDVANAAIAKAKLER